MKVLFVHRDPVLASARVRVLNLLQPLQALGVDCQAVPFPTSPTGPRGLRRLLSDSDVDVFVLQKKLPSMLAGWVWGAARAPIVFDFDDAIQFRREPRNGSYESPTRRRRFSRALRLADAFACGNDYLASFCRAGAKPVLVAPSAVPLDVPRASPCAGRGPARVGWIGAPHNLDELRALAPAFRELAQRRQFVLVVIGEVGLERGELDGVRVEHVPWTLASQEREIARLDVGLMPLVDSPWTRGKCAYKLLQYMAAGVPAVASPVGMNREVISHAENGWLADSPADWVRALDELLSDPSLSRRLGESGRRTVEEHFGVERVAAAWKGFLEQLGSS